MRRSFGLLLLAVVVGLVCGSLLGELLGQFVSPWLKDVLTRGPMLGLSPPATLDLRLLKFFPIKPHGKLDLVVEAFNVLNRTNVTQLNAVYGGFLAPVNTFGRPIDASSARRIQFSVDFEF